MAVPVHEGNTYRPIDILIGLDQYGKFMTKNYCTLSNGLELIESKLGYVMSGPFTSGDNSVRKPNHGSMITTLFNAVISSKAVASPKRRYENTRGREGLRKSDVNSRPPPSGNPRRRGLAFDRTTVKTISAKSSSHGGTCLQVREQHTWAGGPILVPR